MIKQIQKFGLLCSTVTIAMNASALTPTPKALGHQDYVFIENNIDKEYFIAPYNIDPRFSGANVWTRYGRYKGGTQDSLGYMGNAYSLGTAGSFVDIWMESGKFFRPYLGIRCRVSSSSTCPGSGYVGAELVNNEGAFKAVVPPGSPDYNGGLARGSFGPGAYEYFKNLSVGTTEDIYMHVCTTKEYYSPANGGRCKNAQKGNYWVLGFNLTKMGHFTLLDTKAFQEIWYGTDGTPYLNPNGQYCHFSVVNKKDGIECKMLKYNAKGDVAKYDVSYKLSMITDTDVLGFTPPSTTIYIDGGNGAWKPYSDLSQLNKMLVSGENYISVFFTKDFFKKLADAKVNVRNAKSLFTFAIKNSGLSQSGFYQFSVSTELDIIPREYSLSIQPKGLPEGSTPVQSGMIGDSRPILFNYTVKQSAPRQADTIEAYVNAPRVMKNGQSYCSFKSADNKTEVAIPAGLSATSSTNQEIKQYSGCDITKRLNLKNAMWSAVPWDSFGSGYFYSTDLQLIFPMNDPASEKSIAGLDWNGKVQAEGEIKVEAKWIGVNFP